MPSLADLMNDLDEVRRLAQHASEKAVLKVNVPTIHHLFERLDAAEAYIEGLRPDSSYAAIAEKRGRWRRLAGKDVDV